MAKKAAYQAGSEPSHLMCFLYLTCLPMEFGKRAEAKAFKVQMYNFLGQRSICCSGWWELPRLCFGKGALHQFLLILFEEDGAPDNKDNPYNAHTCSDCARQFGNLITQYVCADSIATRPAGAAKGVKQHKARPTQLACACQQCHKYARNGDKAAKENNGIAMMVKQIFPYQKAISCQANFGTVFCKRGSPTWRPIR